MISALNTYSLVCVSLAGTSVQLTGPTDSKVAVLLLGFGGSDAESLQPICEVYPTSWRCIATTRTALLSRHNAAEQQRDEVIASLSGVDRLLVHITSNNGFLLWTDLLSHAPVALAGCVCAIVFDCCPGLRCTSLSTYCLLTTYYLQLLLTAGLWLTCLSTFC